MPDNTIFKRKFRWLATFYKDFVKVAEAFIKLNTRPNRSWIPGKTILEQLSFSYCRDAKDQRIPTDFDTMQLDLLDGCGSLLETWTLQVLKAELSISYSDAWGSCDDFSVSYDEVVYKNCCEPINSPNLSCGRLVKPNNDMDFSGYDWIKVEKHTYDKDMTWEDNYIDLEKHHIEETTFLIAKVRELAHKLKLQKNSI